MPLTSRVQGVVVKPALAIPFFTGVAAFIGNIISLQKSLQNWQQTIIDKVLEELRPLLDRFKPQLEDAIKAVIKQIDDAKTITENSPLASIANDKLSSVKDKLIQLRDSFLSNDIAAFASTIVNIKDDAKAAAQSTMNVKDAILNGALASDISDRARNIKNDAKAATQSIADQARSSVAAGQNMFRKLTEAEVTTLLRSLWTSIR